MKMFIDDERYPPESWIGSFVVIRTGEEAIEFLQRYGCPTFISFDHDLGEGLSGYDVAKYLVQIDFDEDYWMPKDFTYTVHSMNPVGRDNIIKLLDSYLKSKE